MNCPRCRSKSLRTTNTYQPDTLAKPTILHISRISCMSCGAVFTGVKAIVVTDPGPKGLANLPLLPELPHARVEKRGAKWRIVSGDLSNPLAHPRSKRPFDDGGCASREEAEMILATMRALHARFDS